MRSHRTILFLCVVALSPATVRTSLAAQEPASPANTLPGQDSTAKAGKPSKKKHSHEDFLIRGTVFNEKALSLPGVELRLRAEGQKKYKWETVTNSRGEFAVRVPQGANYEILAHAKGFEDQTHTIDAKSGGDEGSVVFRMALITGGKK